MKNKQRILCLLAIGLVMIALTGCAGIQKASAPSAKTESAPDWMFKDLVNTDFVKQYITIPKPENVTLIDSRPKQAKYDKGHIPTAINIPDTSFDKMTNLLPQDKKNLLIFYCEGPECQLSHKSAKKAVALGYTNVKVYPGGFPEWIKQAEAYPDLSVDYVKSLIDSGENVTFIDSRPKIRFDQGSLPKAISIPDTNFDKMTNLLPAKKDALLVFFCGGFDCVLSHKSAVKAIKLGYTNVKSFSAGYPAWQEMNEKTAKTPALEVKKGKDEGTIDIASFERIMKENPASLMIVDVRDPDEVARGAIRPSVNIPVDKLENQISKLSSDKTTVFVCSTGARSGEAYYMTKDKRPELKNVYYIDAEIKYGSDGSYKITPPKK